MDHHDCRRGRGTLLASYGEPHTLFEYLGRVPNAKIISDADKPRYKRFLETTLVIADQGKDISVRKTPPSCEKHSSQKDVVLRVINVQSFIRLFSRILGLKKDSRDTVFACKCISFQKALCRKNLQKFPNKNVLSFGFDKPGKWEGPVVMGAPNARSFHNFNNSNLVLMPNWKTLYSRIGDELMMHLLGETSMFVLYGSTTSSYVQVTGRPIYDVAPKDIQCSRPKNVRKVNESDEKIVDESKRVIPENNSDLTKKQSPVASTSSSHEDVKSQQSINNSLIASGKKRKLGSDFKASQTNDYKKQRSGNDDPSVTSTPADEVPDDPSVTSTPADDVPDDPSVTSTPVNDVPYDGRRPAEMKMKPVHGWRKENQERGPMRGGQETNEGRSYQVIQVCYIKRGKETFSKSCLLERVASNRLIRQLAILIFFSGKETEKKEKVKYKPTARIDMSQFKRLPKRYLKIERMLKELLKRHKACSVLKLLDLYCPVIDYSDGITPSMKWKWKGTHNKFCPQYTLPDDLETLIAMTSTKHQVFEFVKNRILQVIPLSIWGSTYNRNAFLNFVRKFLFIGRNEELKLQELTSNIKVADCKWVYLDHEANISKLPRNTVKKQQDMSSDLLHWLMHDYVMLLVKTCFYVTETNVSRNGLSFYRKVVWNKIHKLAMEGEIKNGTFKPISEANAIKYLARHKLGQSYLRFAPKKSSCRPIVNTRQSGNNARYVKQGIFDVLTFIAKNNPVVVGSSVQGYTDVHPLWRNFVTKHRSSASANHLYFVKTDIAKCFESILPDRLMTIISVALNRIKGNPFIVSHYAVISKHGNRIVEKHKRRVTTMVDFRTDFIATLAKDVTCSNSVFINKVWNEFHHPKELLTKLRKLMINDVVKDGSRYYLRTSGVGQGSMLSSLLSSLYYGYMEQAHLLGVNQDGILLRLVDDFLLVTPHRANAEKFLNILLTGIAGFGCKVGFDKTLTNFPFTYNGQAVNSSSGLFPWCGILINPETLELCNDYSCYVDVDLRFTMTIVREGDVIGNMRRKLCQLMFTKCIDLFIDPVINKRRTCLRNIYEMFLLLAYRFHSYQLTLPQAFKPQRNPNIFLHLLCWLFVKLYNFAMKNLNTPEQSALFEISRSEFIWLGCKALITKLTQHQAVYKKLINLLRKKQQMPKRLKLCLMDATMPSTPESFKKIVT